MTVGVVGALSRSEEALFDARDAYRSAKTLAVLVFAATLIVLGSARESAGQLAGIASAPWKLVAAAELTVAGVAFAWLLATRRRPAGAAALGIGLLLLVPLVPMFAAFAVASRDAGRPWEALVGPKLAMISIALVVPRHVWLGVAFVAVFAIEVVAIHFGVLGGVAGLPRGEPVLSLFYAAAGLAALFMRENRRKLTVRFLRVESEARMLRRAESQLRTLCARFEEPLRVLETEIARLQHLVLPRDETFLRLSRSIQRLRDLALRLARIEGRAHVGDFTVAPANGRSHAAAARAPGAARDLALAQDLDLAPDDEAVSEASREAERRFHAHDAYASAKLMAVLASAGGLVAVLNLRGSSFGRAPALWTMQLVTGLVVLVALRVTRRRPREELALALAFVVFVPSLLVRAYAQAQFAHGGAPYEPFLGHKIAMVILPLVVPRRLWLGVSLEVVLLLETLGLYRHLHLADAKLLMIPFVEPWWTMLYAGIGLALMRMREQRRVASVRLLRDDLELSILARRTALSLAIRDQICSPLQSLSLTLAVLKARHGDPLLASAIDGAVSSMAAAVLESTELDPRALGLVTESFDAGEALSRPSV